MSNWLAEWLELHWAPEKREDIKKQVKEFSLSVSSGFVPKEMKDYRWDLCIGCENFKSSTNQCLLCNCFMPVKVLFKKSRCPKLYWERGGYVK